MMNYYNSETKVKAKKNVDFKSILASILGKSKSSIGLAMFMILTLCQVSWAQSTANYTFSTNTTSSLAADLNGNAIDMTAGTTPLVPAASDQGVSALTNIGFNYLFYGNFFNQFSVSANGILQLGSSLVSGSTYTSGGGSTTSPKFSALGSDAATASIGDGGGVLSKVVGTAPNRCLVVQWVSYSYYTNTANPATFQIRLYENSGNVEYVYGSMPVGATAYSSGYAIGFSVGSAANLLSCITSSTNVVSNSTFTTNIYTAATDIPSLNSTANGSRRAYLFIPPGNVGNAITPVLAAPTALNFTAVTTLGTTLNWTASSPTANVLKYAIYNSTDGGTTYNFVNTTNVGTNTYVATGLTPNTNYTWKVNAISEGGKSADLVNSQATLAAAIYVWNATSGSASWATASSWTPARTTPDAADILQFSNGGNSTATAIPAQTVGRIEFSGNTTANFQSAVAATLTTGKLVIPAGSALVSNGTTAALTLAFSTGAINPIDGTLEISNTATAANAITFANSVTTIGTTGLLAGGGILSGTITGSTTTLIINGTYEHKYTTVAGTIPTALWNPSSTTLVSGYTTNTAGTGGFTQNFNNFTWNCPLQTAAVNLGSSGTTGVAGTFTVTSTNTGSLVMTGTSGYTVNANNFTQTGGTFDLANGASGSGMTFNVAGVFNKTGGTFLSSGTVTSNPTLNFNGTALQSVSFNSQPTGPITYRVSNPIGITLNGSFGTNFAIGNGVLGGLRISTLSTTPITFGGTLTDFTYDAANSRLTYDAAGSITSRALEFPATAGPANLTVSVGTGNTLTIPFSRSLSCATANSVLTMTSGDIDISTNSLTLGASTAFPGTLSYSAGGIKSTTGSLIRWFPITGLPTSAGTSIGFYPFVSGVNNRNVSVYFSTATALSGGGTIAMSQNNGTGLSAVTPSIVDGTFTIDTKGNASWTATPGNGITASGTLGLRLTNGGLFTTAVANLRVIQSTTALGTHVAGSGTNPNYQSNRTGLTLSDLTNTHYTGAAAAELASNYNSIASGNWNSPSTWDLGTVPTCSDIVSVRPGHNVTVNSATNNSKTLTVFLGGTLTVASGDLTVGCTLNNNNLSNNGTLTVTGGTLNINGNLVSSSGSTFNQSGGNINVDGSDGTTANSVATGTSLVNLTASAPANLNLTAGTFTIVDPHYGSSTSDYVLSINQSTANNNANANHTFKFGNGVSTTAGGHANGFYFYTYPGSYNYGLGSVVTDALTGTNRFVKSAGTTGVFGNFTVTSGEYQLSSTHIINGNLVNNGTLTSTGFIAMGTYVAPTSIAPNTVAQSISGTGTFRNLGTAPTANVSGLQSSNTSTTGLTLNIPISVSSTLTLTSGIITTSNTNLLTVGTSTAGGTINGASATNYVDGPIARTIATANANTNYIVFPVGKGGIYSPISLAPSTTAASVFKAEVFNSNSGTANAAIVNLSANKRWEAPLVSGTITDINVRLGDSGIIPTSIPVQAPTAAGQYTSSFGSAATYAAGTPNTTTSTTPVIASNYTGFLSHAVSNACSGTPTPGATTATSSTICFGSTTTLGLTTIPVGSVITYQWQSSPDNVTYTNITGATNSTYAATTANWYQCIVTCSVGPASGTSTPIQITYTNNITATTPGTVCGQGTVTLGATANTGATVTWYAAATGGAPLNTGTTFVTPSLTATTNYFAEASVIGAVVSGARTAPTNIANTTPSSYGLVFDVSSAFNLLSVDVFNGTTSSGTFVIQLQNSTGAILYTSSTFTAPAGTGVIGTTVPYVANLGWNIQPGSNYRLLVTSGTASLVRESSLGGFPYAIGTSGSITSGYISGTSTSYYYLYNWKIQSNCASPRTQVTATVTTAPTLTLSSNSISICSGQTSTPITITAGTSDYDTYTFSPVGGVSGTAGTGFSFNPIATTTYTLTASQSSGSLCSTIQTITVTVNPLPSALTISPTSATTCANNIQTLTATGGTLSNSGSATIGTATTLTTPGGTEPTAFNNRYEHYWLQMVYTQAELLAAGVQPGNINSIKFNITTIGSATNVTDLRIFMGSTSQSVLTGFITAGISEVFSAATYTHTIGINTLTFSTPYVWDGLSNIIVDMRSTGADLSNNSETYYTATTDNKTISAVSTADAFTSSNAYVASNPAGTTSLKRLNTVFDWSNIQNNPITWSPVTNLYTDALATVPYTAGTNAATVYHMATAASAATTYTATATSAATCTSSATTSIAVNATPVAPTAAAQSFCNSATVANLVTTSGTGVQWYANPTGGSPLASTVALTSTTYYATQTVSGCESPRTSVAVTITTPVAPTAVAQSFCNSATVADLVTTSGTGIQWYANPTGGSPLASTVALTSTTYYATQTVSGCESPRTSVAVTITTPVAPTAAAQSFCNSATVANLVTTSGTGIQWYANPTGGSPLASTVALTSTTYYATQTVSGCESPRTSVAVTINTTAQPTASSPQSFTAPATIANIVVTGTTGTVTWYPTNADAIANTNALNSSTVLVNNTTYYATQTIAGCPSTPIAVLVNVTLRNNSFDMSSLEYYPNPVIDVLNISYSNTISSIEVYNLVGQLVRTTKPNATTTQLDMNGLPTATYLVKVTSEGKTADIKIVKK